MKVTLTVDHECECGCILLTNQDYELFCQNIDCSNYGKKFKRPTVELEEVNP